MTRAAVLDHTPEAVRRPITKERTDWLTTMVGITVCLLPFLWVPGPKNSAPADVGIALSVVLALAWIGRDRLPLPMPYVWAVLLLVVGGLSGALFAHAPLNVGFVVAQDFVVLLWAAVITLGHRRIEIIAVVTRAWCTVVAWYATVMACGYILGLDALVGVSSSNGVRASYTFGDPNLAGNYLVVSLFIMRACSRPRSRVLRYPSYLMVLLAIGFTGSNGAFVSLAVGLTLAFLFDRYRASGLIAALTAVAAIGVVAVVGLGVVAPSIDITRMQEAAAGSVPLLRDSVGRSGSSSSERATLVEEGLSLWWTGDTLGYGPGRTQDQLAEHQAPYVKEAHNDYLATILERGVIGGVGLIMLAAAVFTRCLVLLRDDLPEAFAELVPRWWLLVVIGPVMALAGTFYEVLHFRHLWTWLGLIAALELAARRERARR